MAWGRSAGITPASGGLLGLLFVAAGVHVAALVRHWELVVGIVFERAVSRSAVGRSEMQDLDRSVGLAIFATPLIVVSLIWWLASRYKRMTTQQISGEQYTPLLVVTAMFLPVANVVAMIQVSNELWKASDPAVDFQDSTSWQRNPVSSIVTLWQAASLAAFIPMVMFGVTLLRVRLLGQTPVAVHRTFFYGTWASLLGTLALVASMVFVFRLDSRQCRRGVVVDRRLHRAQIRTSGISTPQFENSGVFLTTLGLLLLAEAGLTIAVLAFGLPAWSHLLTGQAAILCAAVALMKRTAVSLEECLPIGPVQPVPWLGAAFIGAGGLISNQLYLVPALERLFPGEPTSVEFPFLVHAFLLPLLILVVAPLLEEILFRGLLFRALATTWSPFVVILTTSLLFGFIHLNRPQMVTAAILGIHCGIARWKTGSLVPALIIHFFNNLLALMSPWRPYFWIKNGWLIPLLILLVGYVLLTEFPVRAMVVDRARPLVGPLLRGNLDWSRMRQMVGLAEAFHLLAVVLAGWEVRSDLVASRGDSGGQLLGLLLSSVVLLGYWRGWRVFVSIYWLLLAARLGTDTLDITEASYLLCMLLGVVSIWMNRRFSPVGLLWALQNLNTDPTESRSAEGVPRWTLPAPNWELLHLVSLIAASSIAMYLLITLRMLSPPGRKIAMVFCFVLAFGLWRGSRTLVSLVALVFFASLRLTAEVEFGQLVFVFLLLPGIVAVWKRREFSWRSAGRAVGGSGVQE